MSQSAVTTVGGLLSRELLDRIADNDSILPGLEPTSFDLAPSERLRDAITRSWNRLPGLWTAFRRAEEALPDANDKATRLTRERWLLPLLNELGFAGLDAVQSLTSDTDGKQYAISHEWRGRVPVHLMGWRTAIDRRTPGLRGAAASSPHGLVQEFLNSSDSHLWGIVSNGKVLRLMRDNASLTRQAYVEFDLIAIFDGESFADFALLWLCCHRTRFEADMPQHCALEQWAKEAAAAGTRARDKLRVGVERAILSLGQGALSHPANSELRGSLRSSELTPENLQRQLLRVVYRLLFLLVAESRNLLLDPEVTEVARDRYLRFYSMQRLCRLARNPGVGTHGDLWQGLQVTMAALDVGEDEAQRAARESLGLTSLGSLLWSQREVADLVVARIDNVHLLEAVRNLAFVRDNDAKALRHVDYANLGTEELGSVYESLLELHAVVDPNERTFGLDARVGSERKTTGSYYTPPELISKLLDDALDPVIEEARASSDPEQALLDLKVLDPACGSGHFLIAAAHRIADALASVREGGTEPSPESSRVAFREVVGRCLCGIDINPMAVELCKVSLWLESNTPGRPLGFLDHRIVCGNSLLGTTPKLLADGITDAAFRPLTGDDRQHVSSLRKANRAERKEQAQGLLELEWSTASDAVDLASALCRIEMAADDTAEQVVAKEVEYARLRVSGPAVKAKLIADAWCAAFVAPKTVCDPPITQKTLRELQARSTEQIVADVWSSRQAIETQDERLTAVDSIIRLANQYQFIHLHLVFPDIFEVPKFTVDATNEHTGWSGGFDSIIGNPPWDQIQYDPRETFASSHPEIAQAPTKAKRDRMLDDLAANEPGAHMRYLADVRFLEGVKHFIHTSGRYPLGSVGRLNTAPLFLELTWNSIAPNGQTGVIVPSGIATDSFSQGFFSAMIDKKAIVSLYDFENSKPLFPVVHRSFKFCLLTLTGFGRENTTPEFSFFAHEADDLIEPDRIFNIAKEDFSLLNPNTKTCPIFRNKRDAEITKTIYQRVPLFVRENDPIGNPWRVSFQLMFMMNTDSVLFRTREELEDRGYVLQGNHFVSDSLDSSVESRRYIPLYEGKMTHQFDHRWATHDGRSFRDVTTDEKQDSTFLPLPRYWIPASEVADRTVELRSWLLGWRDVAGSTDERTFIVSAHPRVGTGHTLPQIVADKLTVRRWLAFLPAIANSFACDYTVRQKVGRAHVALFVAKQVPIVSPLVEQVRCLTGASLIELTYTAWDMDHMARDLGYEGPPFRWDEERRDLIRAELDGLMFHIYGINRQDADYIMDTFPIVKRKDEDHYGDFRTKRLILDRYDAMTEAVTTTHGNLTNTPNGDNPPLDHAGLTTYSRLLAEAITANYQTNIDPPAAHPSQAHPASTRPSWA